MLRGEVGNGSLRRWATVAACTESFREQRLSRLQPNDGMLADSQDWKAWVLSSRGTGYGWRRVWGFTYARTPCEHPAAEHG
jgi:hypothetical protein